MLIAEFIYSGVENFDLNSFSHSFEDLSSNETFSEPSLGKLRVHYTTAGCLLNEIRDLEVLIVIVTRCYSGHK